MRKNVHVNCVNCDKDFVQTSSNNQKYCSHTCYVEHKSGKAETRQCPVCAKEFSARSINPKIYCNQDCYIKAQHKGDYDNRRTVDCHACGKNIRIRVRSAERSDYHFCSLECSNKICVNVACLTCKKPYTTTGRAYKTSKFCSKECRNERNRKEQTHKSLPQVVLTCATCQRTFSVRRSYKDKQIYCSRKCARISINTRYTRGNNPIQRGKGKVEIICKFCGIKFKTFPCRVGRKNYCCKQHSTLNNLLRFSSNERTNLEIAMANALNKSKIKFEEQVVMFNKFMVDIKLIEYPIIIQCDGMYWHDRPKARARDKGQDHYFDKTGYIVLRFNDKQILEHIDTCIKQIKQTIKTGQIPLLHY